MKEHDFDSILKIVIPNLPEYQPGKEVWENISNSIDFDAELEKTIPFLSEHQPDQHSWNRIEKEIKGRRSTTKIVRLLRVPAGIAASILLFVAIYSILKNSPSTTVTYSEEMAEESVSNISTRLDLNDPVLIIEEACQKSSYICETEEFTEKKMLLDKVSKELNNVNKEIDQYGSSISLEKTKIKLENLKAEVLKDLIKQIQS